MKTVKTALGFKKIEEGDSQFQSLQLRSILQDHRASLIDSLLKGGLENYIVYKFEKRISRPDSEKIKDRLSTLRNCPIDVRVYGEIFDTLTKQDFVSLGNSAFYKEIDETITREFRSPDLFSKSTGAAVAK